MRMDDGVADFQPAKRPLKRRRRATRSQLLSRRMLDRRTNAARTFDRLVGDIESDLGGHDQLTAIERSLVEAYAGAALMLDNLNASLLRGEAIDIGKHAQAVSAMARIAVQLGVRRRQRDAPPSLRDYLEAKAVDAEAPE